MPILAKPDEHVIALTSKCGWDCSYCAVRNSHDFQEELTFESLLEALEQVKSGSVATLTGGEPGLAPRSWIGTALEKLEAKRAEIWLETNGLFAKRYPDLLHRFSGIVYHCSRELDPDSRVLAIDHPNVRYFLVVHDGSFPKLGAFMEAHPEVAKWDVVAATYPFETTGPTLSEANRHELLCRYSHKLTLDSIKRLTREKDFSHIRFLNFGYERLPSRAD